MARVAAMHRGARVVSWRSVRMQRRGWSWSKLNVSSSRIWRACTAVRALFSPWTRFFSAGEDARSAYSARPCVVPGMQIHKRCVMPQRGFAQLTRMLSCATARSSVICMYVVFLNALHWLGLPCAVGASYAVAWCLSRTHAVFHGPILSVIDGSCRKRPPHMWLCLGAGTLALSASCSLRCFRHVCFGGQLVHRPRSSTGYASALRQMGRSITGNGNKLSGSTWGLPTYVTLRATA